MQEPRSFIVRMYRLEPTGIAGVVEDVQSGRSVPFHSLGELWGVLTRAMPLRSGKAGNQPDPEGT